MLLELNDISDVQNVYVCVCVFERDKFIQYLTSQLTLIKKFRKMSQWTDP